MPFEKLPILFGHHAKELPGLASIEVPLQPVDVRLHLRLHLEAFENRRLDGAGDSDACPVHAAIAGQVSGPPLCHDHPFVHDEQPVADLEGFREDVGRKQNRSIPAQITNQLAEVLDLVRVQPRGRLVQDQHRRIRQERLGQTDPLPVAARKVPTRPPHHGPQI